MSYTKEERIKVIQSYYENSRSVKITFRKIREFFGKHNRPTELAIQNLVKKFEKTGSVLNIPTPVHTRPARSVENIAAVRDSVAESRTVSVRRRSQRLGLSNTSTWRIMSKDLHLRAYKIQLVQELKPADHSLRRTFADWILESQAGDAQFCKKIIFSDEAHFHLSGYVNKQNCRIWGEENPRVMQEVSMHPQRVTVWCGFWAGGVIGPYFFENREGDALTVNGVRYREMIENFCWPELDGMDLENMWFQQDGATCHTANETLELLQTKFPGRVISKRGDVNWPARSCDLTPLDYFLWGYVKGKVYANNPQTISELKNEIRRVIGEIEPHLCENVVQNLDKRVTSCKKSRGGHLDDIVFHI